MHIYEDSLFGRDSPWRQSRGNFRHGKKFVFLSGCHFAEIGMEVVLSSSYPTNNQVNMLCLPELAVGEGIYERCSRMS